MNKFKLLTIILLLPIIGLAQKSPMDKVFEKYAGKEGFTTVNITGALLNLASGVVSDSTTSKIMSKLESIRILTLEDSNLSKSINFYNELEKEGFLKNNNYNTLMEIFEKGNKVRFYAKKFGNDKLSDLILIVEGEENVLINISGIIEPKNIPQITKTLNIKL